MVQKRKRSNVDDEAAEPSSPAAIEASPSSSPSPPPPAAADDLTNLQLPPSTTSDDPTTFAQLKLSPKTAAAIEEMGFTNLTPIQQKSIPPILAGRDVLGAAKTGSGKTLAFLVPAIEMLQALRFKPRNGTGVMVVSPTRELALQMFGIAREIMGGHSQVSLFFMALQGVPHPLWWMFCADVANMKYIDVWYRDGRRQQIR
jgi:ATP-dependent RNA helicase DDX18/HAS1